MRQGQLAGSVVEHVTLDLRIMNSRPTLDVEFTQKKRKKERKEKQYLGNYDTTSFNYYLHVAQNQNSLCQLLHFGNFPFLVGLGQFLFVKQSECCDFNKFLSIYTLVHPPLGLSPLALGDLGGAGHVRK